ncbi:hypothetical protein CDL12_30565 [Handroanthus impetiginosus]|uniref:Uncharacterized protein n=1 Tax=Handroanthus impetiginosus TaxID=429701 RepID=A0A2G9FV44_9LAMI|nr:hypothetical protein CDL12_30565 [Handroanthus impetiginosus]
MNSGRGPWSLLSNKLTNTSFFRLAKLSGISPKSLLIERSRVTRNKVCKCFKFPRLAGISPVRLQLPRSRSRIVEINPNSGGITPSYLLK